MVKACVNNILFPNNFKFFLILDLSFILLSSKTGEYISISEVIEFDKLKILKSCFFSLSKLAISNKALKILIRLSASIIEPSIKFNTVFVFNFNRS